MKKLMAIMGLLATLIAATAQAGLCTTYNINGKIYFCCDHGGGNIVCTGG